MHQKQNDFLISHV